MFVAGVADGAEPEACVSRRIEPTGTYMDTH